MSLTRQFFREFRPLFRMLEEPFGHSHFAAVPRYGRHNRFADEFFEGNFVRPNLDVAEEANAYVVEAELPGVKKENIEIRIGDNGQSLTIEGKSVRRGNLNAVEAPQEVKQIEGQTASGDTQANAVSTENANGTGQSSESTQLTNEGTFSSTSSFSRTVWLPRPVDGSNVSAKLADGILTVRIPKAEEKGSVKVNIE